jgi:chromosome segregation ATPase
MFSFSIMSQAKAEKIAILESRTKELERLSSELSKKVSYLSDALARVTAENLLLEEENKQLGSKITKEMRNKLQKLNKSANDKLSSFEKRVIELQSEMEKSCKEVQTWKAKYEASQKQLSKRMSQEEEWRKEKEEFISKHEEAIQTLVLNHSKEIAEYKEMMESKMEEVKDAKDTVKDVIAQNKELARRLKEVFIFIIHHLISTGHYRKG